MTQSLQARFTIEPIQSEGTSREVGIITNIALILEVKVAFQQLPENPKYTIATADIRRHVIFFVNVLGCFISEVCAGPKRSHEPWPEKVPGPQ